MVLSSLAKFQVNGPSLELNVTAQTTRDNYRQPDGIPFFPGGKHFRHISQGSGRPIVQRREQKSTLQLGAFRRAALLHFFDEESFSGLDTQTTCRLGIYFQQGEPEPMAHQVIK